MGRFAKNTTVSVAKSKVEIERILMRYGATGFGYATFNGRAEIQFVMPASPEDRSDRRIKFNLELPRRDDCKITSSGYERTSDESIDRAWEQACRTSWRGLKLAIHGMLEAVDAEILTAEQAFLNNIVLPDGRTVGSHILPKIEQSYSQGKVVPMLPDLQKETP